MVVLSGMRLIARVTSRFLEVTGSDGIRKTRDPREGVIYPVVLDGAATTLDDF